MLKNRNHRTTWHLQTNESRLIYLLEPRSLEFILVEGLVNTGEREPEYWRNFNAPKKWRP